MDISGMEKQVVVDKLKDLKRKLQESLETIDTSSTDERLDEKTRLLFFNRKKEISDYLTQVEVLIKRIEGVIFYS